MKLESQITNNHSSLIDNQSKRHSFNYNIFPVTLFMQNKPNFIRFSPQNADFTKKQTQFKPNKAKNKPNLTQYKVNSNPICRKGNNESSCVDKEL